MKALPAVGLASSVVQLIDFSIKILRKDVSIYQPTDAARVDNHTILQNVINTLYRMTHQIDQNELKKLSVDSSTVKLSEAAQHLLKLSDETKALTNPLIAAVIQAQNNGTYGDPNWTVVRQSLLTSNVWKKKEVTALKKKLRLVRRDVDTALLVTLRQYLDQSAETGLPVFSSEGARLHHYEKWQNKAMDAINSNNWMPKNKKHVEEFAKQVDALVLAEYEAHFCTEMFTKLHFQALDDRMQSIATPHEETFEWLFDESMGDDGNFIDWLGDKSGQNLFWLTGKPGSGKSTLIKHLFRNGRIYHSLENWSGHAPGVTATFGFWASGTELQKSPIGLLRTVLYECLQDIIYGPLEQDPGIIQWIFGDRWNQFTSYGGGLHEFAFPELRRGFELMISDVTKKFLFLIDGLDEVDEYQNELIAMILGAVKRDNVKICVSSRPAGVFQDAFVNRPKLVLDNWMTKDIHTYVLDRFREDDILANIRNSADDVAAEMNAVAAIVERASGVFLWATLATDFLLQSAAVTGNMAALKKTAELLPSELDGLLSYLFHSIDESVLEHISRVLRLVDAHGYPSLLPLSFASEADTRSSLSAEIRPLHAAEVTRRVQDMRFLLYYKGRNFLSIFESLPHNTSDSAPQEPHDRLKVTYTHRSMRDFIHSEPIQAIIHEFTSGHSFTTDAYWANASLWLLKTLPSPSPNDPFPKFQIWKPMAECIEYALRLQSLTKKAQVTFLDEVGRAGITSRRDYLSYSDLPGFPPHSILSVESFLDIAIWLNLSGYVTNKVKIADRKELKHAAEYNREMRKRLGAKGGERKWLGSRKCMASAYAQTSPELYMLLEYYMKAVRFATPKPFVEIPACV